MSPFLLQGVVLGATLALLAFGFGLVYFTTGVFHFAHGAAYALAGYALWWLLERGWPAPAAVPAALFGAMLLGWLVEIGLYRPLRERRAGPDVLFLTSLGVFMVVANALALAFGHETRPLSLANPSWTLVDGGAGGSLVLTRVQAVTLGVAATTSLALWAALARTPFGLGLRAYAANPELARSLGLEERRLLPAVAALSGLLAGVAACCVTADVGASPEMGLDAVVSGAVAVVIGGLGSLPGTAVGGLVLGLLRRLTAFWLGARWEEALTFALLLGILLWRPRGLFGRRG